MGTLGEWFKKYNNYTPGNQNNGNNAVKQNPSINQSGNTTLAAWFEKYNNYTPSGADTVQPPTGTEAVVPSTQPNGYKSQNAAQLSSGLSRDDFDSSVRNRNQLRALEESRAQDTRDKVATHMVMTGSRDLPALSEIEKISPFTKGETLSFKNGNGEQKDFTIPYFDYESNKPNTVIQAEGYLKSTGETLKKLQSDIENNSAQLQYYESSVNKYVDELERLAARVQSNPTAAGYAAYNSLYDKYQKAYSEYETFISEHNAKIGLYNDYTQRYETAAADVRKYNEQWDAANLDFFEKSKIGLQNFYDTKETEKQAHREAENEKPWWQQILDANAKSYTITNENPAVYAANAVVENYKNDTSYKEPSDEWTDGQKNIFGYLWAVDKDKAHEFAITVNESIAEEKEGKTSKKIKDWVTKNLGTGILGTAGALILSPTAIADVTDNLAEYAARGRITKKGTLSPFDISQTITGGITEELNETYGTIDKRVPVVGGKGLGDLYQLGYSMAQSMTAGKISKLAGNSGFTYATFFGQGAASGIDKQLDADGTAGQAISYGLVAGAAEALLEAMGMESLFKEGNGKLLKEMLKQGGVEAMEEGLTSVVDFVADTLIMMDKSAVFKAAEEYSKIMSEDKAKLTALMDVLEGIAYDALGGLITGGADTAILAGANKVGQVIDVEKEKSRQEQTIKNADAVIKAYGEAVQQYGENSPQAMELNSKSERAYIEKVRANLRLGMLNGKSTTVTTQERSEEEITQLVTQAQSAGDATAETGYYAGASDQLIKFAQQEKAILKQLTGRNVDIRFYQADAGENGHYDPGTGTIYVNVNSERPFSYIEGHEFTHELENSAGYAEYAEWVKTEGLGAMYNTYKDNIKKRYEDRGISLSELELEQEVVATWTGENLFTDDTTMKKLIKKLSDGKPTLARKIFGGIRRFVSRSRSGITRNHYERALYLYQQMAQGKASTVSSAQTVNENAPTSFLAETAKVPQKQKNTVEAVNTAENDIKISNGEAVAQDNGKFANDSEFTPAVRELVDRIADTARQIEASDQKGADYRRLKKEQKANLRALEQLRRDGKIDSVEYNRAIEALRDTTEGPEYGGIEESKANLQAQYEAGEISQEDYESAMAELEEVGANENSGIKYSLSEATVPTRKELESKKPIKVVDISSPQTQGSFAQRRKQILDNVDEVISKPYLNRDTGTLIFLTKNSYTHAFNNLGDIQLNAAEHLPELIENAVLTHAEKATHGDTHADGVYTFFAAAKSVRVYPVKLKVKEYTYSGQDLPKNIKEYFENSPQGYASSYDTVVLEVEEIEKSPTGSVKDMNQIDPFLDPEELSEISIADLLNLVKGEAEKYIPKYSFEDLDSEYLDVVNSGDMETAQRLVEEAATKAGYTRQMFHETNARNIHVFDVMRGDHGGTDSETPYGIFTKTSNNNIGLGDTQMALYVKADKTLYVENREAVRTKIPELVPYYDEIARIDKKYDALTKQLEDAEFEALEEWIDKNPDADMDEVYPTSYIISKKPANIDSQKYHDAHNEYNRVMEEWSNKYNNIAVKCKKIITAHLRDYGYDSMYFGVDGGSRGRRTDSLILLDPEQVKSAEPVTHDDDGNIIPLSERFNSEKTDIRFSLEEPTREDVISELRQYMSGARSKDQIRDVIAKVKKNPQSEIYGGPARRPQYSEGVQKILADAEREGMSVRDYISQNIDEFEVRGKLTEDARKALEISGDYRKFSVEDVRANRPPRSIEELDRILAEAEPLDPNEFRKTDFDRWYERREKEDQLHEKMGELVMKAPDENEINTTLEELASDLENGYITPDAALEIVEGLRVETDGAKVKYSVEETTDGRPVVVIDNDILAGIDTTVWDKETLKFAQSAAKEALNRFSNGIPLNNILYKVNSTTKSEFTYSNYSKKLYRKNKSQFADKMRMSNNVDEILSSTDGWWNDGNLDHERDDSFVDFAHGYVLIQCGKNQYIAETVVGITSVGEYVFYDIVDINPDNFQIKKGTSQGVASGNNAFANIQGDSFEGIVPQDPEVVKPAVKKSVEDNWTAEEKEFLEELSRQRAESGDMLDYQAANQEDLYAYTRQVQREMAEFDAQNERRAAEKALAQRRAKEAEILELMASERAELDALDAENERQKAEEARIAREADEAEFLEALANERKELDALDAENERQKAEEARAIREANEAELLEALNEQRKDLDKLDNVVQKDGEGEETELQEEIKSNAMDRYLQLGDAAAIYVTDLGKSSDSTPKIYEQYFSPSVIQMLRKKYQITNVQGAADVYRASKSFASKASVKERLLELTEEDKALAREILCGDRRIFEISDRSHRDEFLEYIALLGEREIMAEAWRNWRVERRNQWQKEADEMFKTFDSSVKGGDFERDKNKVIKIDKKKGTAKLEKDGTDRAGYKYARETQTRITYDIFADDKFAEAKAFNDWLFAPERASEAQSNRYKNKMRDRVRKMNLDLKVKKGDTLSEAAAVQLVGELQDIIRRTERQAHLGNDKYKVNGFTYAEATMELANLKGHNPGIDFSPKGKIQNAITEFTDIYAKILSDMNEVLVRNGYPPVFARSGYFPHFADEGDTLIRRIGRALGIDTDVSVLPTGINGLTHTFKPGKTWFANALERKGPRTAYDAVLGFDKYIEGAANVIFHTDNIQRQRAFARAIRYNASDNVIKKRIVEVFNDENMNDDEKDLQIQYLSSQAKFRHSAYVVQLEDHTNSLAGKKTFSDRDMEKLLGRKAYTWMKNIEGRTAANMIAGNLSSAFSNSIPLRYCVAEMGEWQTLRAMIQTIKSYHTDDGFVDRSDFLTNRYGSEFLVKSGMEKISETLSIPMEAIDHFTAQVLVRAAYNKYLKKGASPELAMERANSFAAGVMADRSRGALPEIFNNKNPLYKAFAMFQVEVNNNISHILKDIPREYRDENKAKWIGAVTWILARLFFGIWCFNETAEKIFGRRMAGTDVIDAANNLVGDITGYQYPNGWDILEAKFEGENIRDLFKTDRENVGQTIWNLGVTAAEEMPFLSSFFGGGELPVASARPDFSKLLPTIGSDKDPMNIAQTWIEEFGRPVSYMLLPFGANQASKMLKGGSALLKGGSYKTNSKGEEILQYPIYSDNVAETAWDHLRTVLLGKSSTDQSREWVDSGFKSLSARGTAAYKGMIAAGVDEGDAHSLIIDIMSVEPTDQEIEEKIVSMGGVDRVFTETVSNGPTSDELKCEIIRNADISGEGKAILYFSMIANESECKFMSSLQEAGADMGAVVAELLDKKTGSDAHKYSAIMSSGLPEAEQLWQIYQLDTSADKSTHKRYYVASDTFGISPNEYRVANDFLTNYLDGNSKTNERVAAAVREYAETVPLTKTEKAVLWQLLSKSTSAKDNPFDVRTGERVLTAINNYDREEEEFYAKYGPQPQ